MHEFYIFNFFLFHILFLSRSIHNVNILQQFSIQHQRIHVCQILITVHRAMRSIQTIFLAFHLIIIRFRKCHLHKFQKTHFIICPIIDSHFQQRLITTINLPIIFPIIQTLRHRQMSLDRFNRIQPPVQICLIAFLRANSNEVLQHQSTT
jgi:hypothetical protein